MGWMPPMFANSFPPELPQKSDSEERKDSFLGPRPCRLGQGARPGGMVGRVCERLQAPHGLGRGSPGVPWASLGQN